MQSSERLVRSPAAPWAAGLPLLRSDALPIALLVLAGAGLRLVMLGTPPLWTDEAFQAVVAAKPLGALLAIVSHDSSPPLSYLLVHFATLVVPSAAGVRLVSALAGCTVVLLGAALGRRLGGQATAVVAAALLAILPAEVIISRDARMYALAAALALASLLTLLRCADKPAPGRFALWALCAAAGVYTHYFMVVAIVCQLAAVSVLLRHDRRFLLGVAAATAGVVLLAVPWAVYALPQLVHLSAPFWVHPLTVGRLQELPVQLVNGTLVVPGGTVGDWIHDLRLACVPALFAGLGWLAWRRGVNRQALVMLAAGIAPVLVIGLISLRKPLFEPRYLEPLWQPLLPVVALGLARIPWRAFTATLLLPMALTAPLAAYTLPNANIPALLARLPADLGARDQVFTSGSTSYFPLYYYGGEDVKARLRISAGAPHWYDGVAAMPAGVYTRRIPYADGKLYLFGNPNYWAVVPAGYTLLSTRCIDATCLRTYAPAAGAGG